jgi:hypothetical protein
MITWPRDGGESPSFSTAVNILELRQRWRVIRFFPFVRMGTDCI